MKTNCIRTLAMVALGLLTAAALGTTAAAQGITSCQGKFTLPHDVRWQGRVLPAGEYSYFLESAALPAPIVLRGPKGVQFILSPSQVRRHDGQQSFMTIEPRGGSGYVRELYLAPIGVHFFYQVPKPPKEQLLAKQLPATERVLISQTGK